MGSIYFDVFGFGHVAPFVGEIVELAVVVVVMLLSGGGHGGSTTF